MIEAEEGRTRSHPISITFHLMFYGLFCSFSLFIWTQVDGAVRYGHEAAGIDDTHLRGQQSNYVLTFLLFSFSYDPLLLLPIAAFPLSFVPLMEIFCFLFSAVDGMFVYYADYYVPRCT